MITAGLVTSFKGQLLLGQHDLLHDVIKIALYTSAANLGPETTVYSATDEVSSSGYTPGGAVLAGAQTSFANGTGYASFTDPEWLGVAMAPRAALIYNYTKGNKAIGVINFGTDQTTLNQNFKIQFPPFTPESALIRIL